MRLRSLALLAVTTLSGCPMLVSTTSTPDTGPTGDTHTTSDTNVDTLPPTETADTAVPHTGDTGSALECDPDFSQDCVVVDGECRDPLYEPPNPLVATNDVIDGSVQNWLEGACSALAWLECPGGAVVRARWGLVETATVDVYDESTREWVAGFLLTDVPYEVCGAEIWVGDDTWYDCARDAYDWVSGIYGSCVRYPEPCNSPPECLRDEVPR